MSIETATRENSLRTQLELLQKYGSNILWGDKNKGYLNFVREIHRGESRLRHLDQMQARKLGAREGLLRESDISCIYVYAHKKVLQLVEDFQLFKNGHIFPRGFLWVTEKTVTGESPEQTAYRGLRQELGLDIADADNRLLIPQRRLKFRRQIIKDDTANTYPGLQSRMTATDFEVHLTDEEYENHWVTLPSGKIVHGFAEVQDDKTTFFTYRQNE